MKKLKQDSANKIEPIYKRELKYDEKTNKLTLNERVYVPVEKSFSDEIVKQMKTGAIYEDLVAFDGVDYMLEDRYKAYSSLAKALKNT